MADWQPIETAPKDGTSIYVFFDDGTVLTTYWLVPLPLCAGWFPWYFTHHRTATHWAAIDHPSNPELPK